jgi:hypothetical protein
MVRWNHGPAHATTPRRCAPALPDRSGRGAACKTCAHFCWPCSFQLRGMLEVLERTDGGGGRGPGGGARRAGAGRGSGRLRRADHALSAAAGRLPGAPDRGPRGRGRPGVWSRRERRFLGEVGLHDVDWSGGVCSVGYWLRSSARGQGFTSEALGLLQSHASSALGLQRFEAHIARPTCPVCVSRSEAATCSSASERPILDGTETPIRHRADTDPSSSGWSSKATCARPSNATNSRCITSRSSRSILANSSAGRRWCGGSTRSGG